MLAAGGGVGHCLLFCASSVTLICAPSTIPTSIVSPVYELEEERLAAMVVSSSSIRDMGNLDKIHQVDSDGSIASVDDKTSHAEYRVRRSRLIGMVNWWHVALTFYPRVYSVWNGCMYPYKS